MFQIEKCHTDRLKDNSRNPRIHPKKQIGQIANSIQEFGFTVPILVDEADEVIAGHARKKAAEQLGLARVPVIRLHGLSDAKKRALALAENKISQNAGWDRERLAVELRELTELLIEDDLEIGITGFEPVEIDQLQVDWTTIMAAEQIGRRGFGLELDPRYVDVSIRRWQNFTGRDAIHLDTGRTFDECASTSRPRENAPRTRAALRGRGKEAGHGR